jgi:hypothetical protein
LIIIQANKKGLTASASPYISILQYHHSPPRYSLGK